jgi:hypothetical protein
LRLWLMVNGWVGCGGGGLCFSSLST